MLTARATGLIKIAMTLARLALPLVLLAMPALAAPGGPIGTLQRGPYLCELPGDAAGPAGLHQPGEDFTVTNASSYETPQGRGSYLLTGKIVVMTSGPKRGQRFRRDGSGFLRKLAADGTGGELRCVRIADRNR